MARRKQLTDTQIANLALRPKAYAHPDPELPGLYVRVRPTGAKVFCAVARSPSGRQFWHTIGPSHLYPIEQAREKARQAIKDIREGKDRSGPEPFETVAEEWFKRRVEARGVITAGEMRKALDRWLIPAWAGRDFASVRRGDVVKLLDDVEDKKGPILADYILAITSMLCNWYATRNENYSSPIVRGMRRTSAKEMARDRILDDDELREVWRVAEANGVYGALLRVALLTAQRREKVVSMKWSDLDLDTGLWTIEQEKRQKGTAGSLLLSEAALAIIKAQPRFASNPYVFAGRGTSRLQGMSKRKDKFDDKLSGVAPWTVHDLRRTARSLMSRAAVRPDIAERVLGHVQGGVLGIYDRHEYREEKAHALRALAGLILSIVNSTDQKVIALRK